MIWLDAIDQARAIRRKEVSSLELTSAFTDESPIVEMRGS